MVRMILASASPRRRELMKQIGYECEIIPSACDEKIEKKSPAATVTELSARKSADTARKITGDAVVIGADTIVSIDSRILGKPTDEKDAFRMLQALQGHTHEVCTGVTIIYKEGLRSETISFTETTSVTVAPMTDTEILSYIATKDPMDKAGAYGIQGSFAKFVTSLCGDYYNVVGLPVAHLYRELKDLLS